jgi:hypothetical protein
VDIKTILGGLMSGGFETIYSTAIITTGMLSSLEGQQMQIRAYDDIMTHYDSPEQAFEHCLTEEKSPYVMAIVKEALRFYPPLKLLPARQTFKEFVYRGAKIPIGVLVYLNAQAVNRGKIFLSRYGIFIWLTTKQILPRTGQTLTNSARNGGWMTPLKFHHLTISALVLVLACAQQ